MRRCAEDGVTADRLNDGFVHLPGPEATPLAFHVLVRGRAAAIFILLCPFYHLVVTAKTSGAVVRLFVTAA